MDAFELYELTRRSLETCGAPEWKSPEAGQGLDQLWFLPGASGETPVWVLGPPNEEDRAVVVDTEMAADLIRGHLQDWLAGRGWQVQFSQRGGKPVWRLADCLSPVDGGGDRLDVDYPSGDDLLAVLCASVKAISSQ